MKFRFFSFLALSLITSGIGFSKQASKISIPNGVVPVGKYDGSWDPNTEIKNVFIIGDVDEQRRAIYQKARTNLVDFLTYWQGMGLQDPHDINELVFIGNGGNRTVAEILAEMNHVSANKMRQEILKQWDAFKNSEIYRVLSQIFLKLDSLDEDQVGTYKTSPLTYIFDHYAFMRWGLSIHNIVQAIEEDETYEEAQSDAEEALTDNAFKSALPLVKDLSLALKSKTDIPLDKLFEQGTNDAENWYLIFFTSNLEGIIETSPESMRRQIVSLPREGERVEHFEEATANDFSVMEHEASHNLEELKYGYNNRLIAEDIADMGTALRTNCPIIGAGFANASGPCADRMEEKVKKWELELKNLKKQGKQDPKLELKILKKRKKIAAFRALAKKGYLRRMDNGKDIYSNSRFYKADGPYAEGDVIRQFIWEIFEFAQTNDSTDVNVAKQMLFLRLIQELDYLPAQISSRSKIALMLAGGRRTIMDMLRMSAVSSKLKKKAEKKFGELSDDQKELISKKAEYAYSEKMKKKEEFRNKRRPLADKLTPWSLRKPAIEVDYISQTVIAAVYRLARNEEQYYNAELVDKIKEVAGRLLHRKVETVTLDNGIEEIHFRDDGELFFGRYGKFRQQVKEAFEIMEENKRINHFYYLPSKKMKEGDTMLSQDGTIQLTKKEVDEILKESKKKYEEQLEKIHELGRIGYSKRFHNPRPGLEFYGQVGSAFMKGLLKSWDKNKESVEDKANAIDDDAEQKLYEMLDGDQAIDMNNFNAWINQIKLF